jgi:o-succinylbenzoate synthase
MIKIDQLEIYQSPVLLKKPFVTSLSRDTHAKNIVVVIRTDEGITGFGECNPFLPISGESMESAFAVAQYLAQGLLHKNPLDITGNSALMDAIIYGNASIKSALDIALYDIASQQAGIPLYAFLGGSKNKKIVTDYTVSIGEVNRMVTDAESIIENGFSIIKIKLGESYEKDVERIRRIRETAGRDITLRIDANQGWSKETAIEILQDLDEFNIQHCEEPIARFDFMELPEVRQKSSIPVMADESCCDHHDAKRLIAINACDSINIKLGKSSGIYKALKISALAEEADLNIQVGGFLESRLGFTASAHLALACKNALYFDFDTPLMFVEDPVTDGITYSRGGVITMPDKPGLGASIEDGYLHKLNKIIIR